MCFELTAGDGKSVNGTGFYFICQNISKKQLNISKYGTKDVLINRNFLTNQAVIFIDQHEAASLRRFLPNCAIDYTLREADKPKAL